MPEAAAASVFCFSTNRSHAWIRGCMLPREEAAQRLCWHRALSQPCPQHHPGGSGTMALAAVAAKGSFSWGWSRESTQAPGGALARQMLPSLLLCCSTGMIYIPSAQLETSCGTALENQTASSHSKAEIQELEVTGKGRRSPNSP